MKFTLLLQQTAQSNLCTIEETNLDVALESTVSVLQWFQSTSKFYLTFIIVNKAFIYRCNFWWSFSPKHSTMTRQSWTKQYSSIKINNQILSLNSMVPVTGASLENVDVDWNFGVNEGEMNDFHNAGNISKPLSFFW